MHLLKCIYRGFYLFQVYQYLMFFPFKEIFIQSIIYLGIFCYIGMNKCSFNKQLHAYNVPGITLFLGE